MHTLSLKLPADLFHRINAAILKGGMTKSTLIRQALEHYLDEPHVQTGSFLDLAGNLCGAVSGPKDLASHSKHMEGYGE